MSEPTELQFPYVVLHSRFGDTVTTAVMVALDEAGWTLFPKAAMNEEMYRTCRQFLGDPSAAPPQETGRPPHGAR